MTLEFEQELKRRSAEYKSGKAKSYSLEEAKNAARKALKVKKQKHINNNLGLQAEGK